MIDFPSNLYPAISHNKQHMYPTIIYGLYSRKQGRCRITVAAALLERLARSATEAELVAQWVLRQAAPRLALCAAAATAKESKTYSVQCCNNAQQRIVASC